MKRSSFYYVAALGQVVNLAVAKVISIPASGKWDGTDGPWSSFHIFIGTNPAQRLRLLPGFVTSSVVPISGEECAGILCNNADPELTYFPNGSSTWRSLDLPRQSAPIAFNSTFWSYGGQSDYGEDDLSVREADGTCRQIVNATLVAPMSNVTGFSVGILGLMEAEIIRKFADHTTKNLMALINKLKQDGLVGVRAWSYTAGLLGRNVTGSLVLGGYDANRVVESQMLKISDRNVSDANNLYLALHAVGERRSGQYTEGFLVEPITVKLVSETSQIWLPNKTCENIASMYGLRWNETYRYYLLDGSKHDELKKLNASLIFKIASDLGSTDSVLIELPYECLDLSISVNGTSYRYFPIKPTTEPRRYVLGRAFFQGAHISVNYEARSISVGQARFPEHGESPLLLDATGKSVGTEKSRQPPIGALVGGITGVIALILIGMLVWRRRRMTTTLNGDSHTMETPVNNFPALLHDSQKPELPATSTVPPPAYRRRLWSTATTVSEVDGIDTMLTSRLDRLQEEFSEAPDKVTPRESTMPPVELEGSSLSPAELDAGFEGFKLAEDQRIIHTIPARHFQETSTIKDHETESFASLSPGGPTDDHDGPVSPLVSRSASRASSNIDGAAS